MTTESTDGGATNDDGGLTTSFVPLDEDATNHGAILNKHCQRPIAQIMDRDGDAAGVSRHQFTKATQTAAAAEAAQGLFGSSNSRGFERTPGDEDDDESDDGDVPLFVNEDDCCCGCCTPSGQEESCCYCDNNAQLCGLQCCLAPCHACDFFAFMCSCCNDASGSMCLEGCCHGFFHCCCGVLCAP